MESKAIIELTRYENLVMKSMELNQFKKAKDDLEETIKKLKDLIFDLCQDEYNLKNRTLEECTNLLSDYNCGLNKKEHLMMSGLITPKEMQDYITRRWNEEHKENANDDE